MAVLFNAHADRLYNGALPVNNAAYTACMWIKPHAGNPADAIYFESDAAGTTYALASSGGVIGILNAGGGFVWDVTLGAAMTNDVWYFVAMSLNGLVGTLYRGTESSAVASASGAIAAQGASFRVYVGGDAAVAGFAPVADIAHVRVWNAILSAAEIEAERIASTPARVANLSADWRLATAATKLVDSSGAGNTLTAAGAGPWADAADPTFGITGTSVFTLPAITSAMSGFVVLPLTAASAPATLAGVLAGRNSNGDSSAAWTFSTGSNGVESIPNAQLLAGVSSRSRLYAFLSRSYASQAELDSYIAALGISIHVSGGTSCRLITAGSAAPTITFTSTATSGYVRLSVGHTLVN